MSAKTYKQKIQEEEYKKWKRQQGKAGDLFGQAPQQKALHIDHICSVCGSKRASRSSDFGSTWQCWEHAKRL